jgi:hypothetical protein
MVLENSSGLGCRLPKAVFLCHRQSGIAKVNYGVNAIAMEIAILLSNLAGQRSIKGLGRPAVIDRI